METVNCVKLIGVSYARSSYKKIEKRSGKQPIRPMSPGNVIFVHFLHALIRTRLQAVYHSCRIYT